MRHYKFVNDPKSVPSFLKGRIKFTPIPELNDPSELTSNVIPKDVLASLKRLRKNGYTSDDLIHLQNQGRLLHRLAPGFQAVTVPRTTTQATELIRSSFYDQMPVLEDLLGKTAAEISKKVGIFCVSKRFDSLPMWAHYAANASGLVVEFVRLDDIFSGDDTGVLQKLVSVRYQRETSGVTFEPQSHESLFFEKFEDWSYEKEVRVVMPLEECDHLSVGGNALFLYSIPTYCISRIILGWRMERDVGENIRQNAAKCQNKVEVITAKVLHGRVVL